MKRGKYIYGDSPVRGLVHQHHYLLLFAWKLKQGLLNNTKLETLKNYIEYFFHQGLLQHLKKEEKVLFSELSEDDSLRKKLEYCHERIRERIDLILNNGLIDEDQVESLCKLLINVVKYEEKEMIPYLEEKLDNIESSWVKLEMSELDEEIIDEFKPEFWINYSE